MLTRTSLTGSIASITPRSIKQILNKKRCYHCCWTGLQPCPNCKGCGMIVGEDWILEGYSAVSREPCRRCIGRGKVDCRFCN